PARTPTAGSTSRRRTAAPPARAADPASSPPPQPPDAPNPPAAAEAARPPAGPGRLDQAPDLPCRSGAGRSAVAARVLDVRLAAPAATVRLRDERLRAGSGRQALAADTFACAAEVAAGILGAR